MYIFIIWISILGSEYPKKMLLKIENKKHC